MGSTKGFRLLLRRRHLKPSLFIRLKRVEPILPGVRDLPVKRKEENLMKNLKSKIRDFLNSEEGRVGVKAPLALGVAAGGLMFAQAMVTTPEAVAL